MASESEIPKFFEVEEQVGTPCGCSAPDCEEDGYPFAFGVGDDFPGYVEACPKHARSLAWETWIHLRGADAYRECRVCGGEGTLSSASPPGPCATCGGSGAIRG